MEQVNKIYEDNNFPGINKLWQLVKKAGVNVKLKDVRNFIENQRTEQLHKKAPKQGKRPITVSGPHLEYQMDLLDMSQHYHQNSHYKFILLVIDIFTRKGSAIPLKNKTAETTLEGIQKAFQELGPPKVIASDNGGEFKGVVAEYFRSNKIIQKMNEVGDHNVLGVVDRFSKTIKNLMYKYFTHTKKTKWIDRLLMILEKYNESPHATLKNLSPNEAEKYEPDTRRIHASRVGKTQKSNIFFHIGDIVRILLPKTKFSRGYKQKWSSETYKITGKIGLNWVLDNDKKNRDHQLQKVTKEDKGTDDVVEQDTREFRREQLLRREGIEESNIIPPPPPSESQKISDLIGLMSGQQTTNTLAEQITKLSQPSNDISLQISKLINSAF